MSGLTLHLLEQKYAVCRLKQASPLPDPPPAGEFFSITVTPEELSLVCPEDHVPSDSCCEKGWRYLMVAGPLDFSLTGILASLTAPLAEAGVPIFAVSTFNTDYILVKERDLTRAFSVLGKNGYIIQAGR